VLVKLNEFRGAPGATRIHGKCGIICRFTRSLDDQQVSRNHPRNHRKAKRTKFATEIEGSRETEGSAPREPSAMSFSESFSSARSTFMIPDEVGTYFIPRPVRACALARMHSDVHPSFHRVAGSRANFPVNVADRKAHVSKVTLHLAGGMRLAVCAGISFRCSAEPAQSELYDLFRRRGA